MGEVKFECLKRKKKVISLRSTSRESEQRIPLCSFKKILLGAIRDLCEFDGSIQYEEDTSVVNYSSDGTASVYDSGCDSVGSNRVTATKKGEEQDVMSSKLISPRSRRKVFIQQPRRSSLLYRKSENLTRPSLRRSRTEGSRRSLRRKSKPSLQRNDSSESLVDVQLVDIPYLAKLSWACVEAGFSKQFADLVGSRFLGLESAHPVTHVQGRVPLMSELVDVVAQVFMKITSFADLVIVFVDDFQWVDNFTWKVIRALGQSGKKMVLICAVRSHDKQAVRRISTAVNFRLEITLAPLNIPDIKQFILSVLSCDENSVDDTMCEDVYQMTGGLPVFVIEMLEDIKRNRTSLINEDGKLRLSKDQLAAVRTSQYFTANVV